MKNTFLLLIIGLILNSCSSNIVRLKKGGSIIVVKRIEVTDTLSTNVIGKVVNRFEGFALPNAEVRLENSQEVYTAKCDSKGAFEFANIPKGKYRIMTSFIGYSNSTDSLDIKAAEKIQIKVKLYTVY
ncbi:carboxypeptidase-like regulatory domain-containing protein [Rufibacter sp. LB8]|uniref:carboxypeptidase-like regulatory domain-containing protein n=1 Tax=Rufibacter sp. LB8 TaxID=2777781 RepID=UPI00178C426B|nr:carboxypeptidase-like regulatory domain-containing protein [Rufibacter sp. LB8]